MRRFPWLAALLNFFFPGAGYLYNGKRKLLGLGWLLCAFALTWVEFSIKEAAPHLYLPMFATVFVMNTCFAIDAWREAKTIQAEPKPAEAVA